jgi:hypothetical protein
MDKKPVRVQLAPEYAASWDARLVDRVSIMQRRWFFWLMRRIWPLSLVGVLVWLGWMVWAWCHGLW